MQPLLAAEPTNPFQINIKTRNQHPDSTEQLTLDTFLTCKSQKISQIHSKIISSGMGESYLYSDDWILVFELFCNPGEEKELISQINRQYEENITQSMVGKILSKLRKKDIRIDTFECNAKVLIRLSIDERHKEKRSLKLFETLQDLDDISLHFVMNGEKVTKQNVPPQVREVINFSAVELNLKSTASQQLGSFIQQLLQYFRIYFHTLVILPQLQSCKINLTSTTLERIDELLKVSWGEIWVNDTKKIFQNEFKFYFGYKKQFMSESNIKIDSLQLFMRQMQKTVYDRWF